jgi:hypothetical protein
MDGWHVLIKAMGCIECQRDYTFFQEELQVLCKSKADPTDCNGAEATSTVDAAIAERSEPCILAQPSGAPPVLYAARRQPQRQQHRPAACAH